MMIRVETISNYAITISLCFLLTPCVASEVQYFESGDVRLGYSVEGTGPPVILLHGLLSNSNINWRARGTMDLLAKNFQVTSLDMRGHGYSDKPPESTMYGVELVNDVVRLMDHLGIQRAHVVGYSTGGEVVLKLMVMYPDRIISAIIGGTGWLRESGPSYQSYIRVSKRLSLLDPGDQIVSSSFGSGHFTKAEIDVINSNDPHAISAFASSALELAVDEAELIENKVPVLAIYGEKDAYRPDIERLMQRLSSLTTSVVPDQDHDGTIGAPKFRRDIEKWLLDQYPPNQ